MNTEEIMFFISVYNTITFMTVNRSLVIRINPRDLLDRNSVIKRTLEAFPKRQFYLSTVSCNNEVFNTEDEFVRYYLYLLENEKVASR